MIVTTKNDDFVVLSRAPRLPRPPTARGALFAEFFSLSPSLFVCLSLAVSKQADLSHSSHINLI